MEVPRKCGIQMRVVIEEYKVEELGRELFRVDLLLASRVA